MSFVAPKLPAGLYRNGTIDQSAGRWYDANLVRFYENATFPVGGWAKRSTSTVATAARACLTWLSNTIARRIAVGSPSKLQIMDRAGTVYDVTPVGLTAGRADAVAGGGYGSGLYGAGTYGTARLGTGSILDATVWSLDTFGQYLVACNADDGKLYEWQLDTGTPAAAIGGAPTSNSACLVTEEGFVLALGAGGNPRQVQWCDQRDDTTWTPTATNQAGDYELQTQGRIMCGRRTRGAHLILTDLDLHRGTYQGPPYVYSFEKIGEGCGAISRAAAIPAGDSVFWMGLENFWFYNGVSAQPLPCDVWDAVFADLNRVQRSKIWAEHNATFGEVTWQFPSGSSLEIDRYVTYNYRENHWIIGQLVRLSGIGAGVFENPIRIGDDGSVYDHETGYTYDDMTPYVESGPLMVGAGEQTFTVLGVLPDERTEGQVEMTFYGRFYPNGTETTFGPYDLSVRNRRGLVDARFSAREVRVRQSGATLADWRVGPFKLDIAVRGAA